MKSRHFFCFSILALCLLLISVPALSSSSIDPITAADDLFSKRIVHENLQQAADILKQFITKNPDNSDALWRLARCCWYLGDRATDKKVKLEFYTQGQGYAKQAVKANNNEIQAHYWLSALLGSAGQTRGILQSLFMVSPMKAELEICLGLDPKFADAHAVLAQLYWQAPGPPLSIGNIKRALEEAKLAVTYKPDSSEYWLYLGQISTQYKDYKTAREAFQQSISLPDDPEEPDSSQKFKATASEELKKIEGK